MPVKLTPILKKFDSLLPMTTQKSPKAKVHFKLQDISDVAEFIRCYREEGAFLEYRNFAESLQRTDTEDSLLATWLQQLKDNIFLLDVNNEHLVGVILKMNWTDRGVEFVEVYKELILNLVSAHTCYLRPVLKMLIQIFLKASLRTHDSKAEISTVTAEEQKVFDRAHVLLQEIINLVPLTPNILLPLLADSFPYMRKDPCSQVSYVKNILRMCGYLSVHRQKILGLLIDKVLNIDVHCPKDKIEESEEEAQMDTENVFLMETDEQSPTSLDMKDPLANTLDVLMENIFQFIDTVCGIQAGNKGLNWEAAKQLYKDFLVVFDKMILPTHASVHVQFILFYLCSLHPMISDGFLDYLWKKVQNPNTPCVIRQASACYIGSLLARATYISLSTVTACFDLMCGWIHSYIENLTGSSRVIVDTSLHGTFYAVCQAIFYVFAFRHKELIEMKNGLKYLRGLNLERVVTCRLNPLKVCMSAVVRNFANVARNYQLVYCYTIIERNSRTLLPVAASQASGSTQSVSFSKMETFFPFDPYLLKRSRKWITSIYRVYDGEVEQSQPEHEEEDDFLTETISPSSTAVGVTPSSLSELMSYGISPGFKQVVSSKQRI
ncbi:RNA polymerase I-specific transcription initiation factor RRN3 homolog Tif-IA [Tachypleus tridentatus]|uniref:RNA polymerase I-specific transcription initiation factor RRN3 homolog Tif-IA n=1 Tax=Tachypleus tridentatus TaxID=6853 RepID=UPI003FD56A5D